MNAFSESPVSRNSKEACGIQELPCDFELYVRLLKDRLQHENHHDHQHNYTNEGFDEEKNERPSLSASYYLTKTTLESTFVFSDLLIHLTADRQSMELTLSTMIHDILSDQKNRMDRIGYFNTKSKYLQQAKLELRGENVVLSRTCDLRSMSRSPRELEDTLHHLTRTAAAANQLFRDRKWTNKYHRRSRARILDGNLVTF